MSAAGWLVLALVGTVVPYAFFAQFFAAEGLAGNFIGALFANGASGGFTADLVISSVAFWFFLRGDARRSGVRRPWLFVVLNLLVGLSCALPLYGWARQRASSGSTAA